MNKAQPSEGSQERNKVFSLLRCSTNMQDLGRQKTDIERLRLMHGFTIERTIELEDVSGRTVLENADVEAMLGDLKRPDIRGGAVSALDRLFRPDDFSDFRILDFFRHTKKLIFSAKEGVVDPSTDRISNLPHEWRDGRNGMAHAAAAHPGRQTGQAQIGPQRERERESAARPGVPTHDQCCRQDD
jgi:hypothetical protein